MTTQKDIVLKPGLGVDLVFNLDTLSPISKSSIVFDQDEKLRQVTVAQPTPKISKDYKYDQMHLSTLVTKELSGKVRLGYKCKIIKLINKYQLANQGVADAILLEYQEPLVEINIRAAFRLYPNTSFDVMGKLFYHGKEFYSGIHFKIYNVSVSGIGLLIPKKIKKDRNPLLDIETNKTGKIGLLLKKTGKSDDIITIESDIKVVRSNSNFNAMSGFAGLTFAELLQKNETALNKFIHEAQLHEIRQTNRL